METRVSLRYFVSYCGLTKASDIYQLDPFIDDYGFKSWWKTENYVSKT